MENKLYEKDLYINKGIECIIGSQIYEYDIKQAGYNITKYFKLLSEDKLSYLSSLSRENKHIKIGLYQRKYKEYREGLKEGFKKVRKMFFEENNLNEEDIISIKKDAIFINKKISVRKFGNIEFVKKNVYTSYYYINGLELYFNNKKKKIDVKGISDSLIKRHDGFMLDFLIDIFTKNEHDPTLEESAELLLEFAEEYKTKQLPIEFYREFNKTCAYKTNIEMNNGRQIVYLDQIDEHNELVKTIDIRFNYLNVIMPLIRITF